MNIPRHQFHPTIENNLLLFLKTANEYKNEGNCDFEEYEKLKLLYPLDEQLKQKLKIYTENANNVIEIISDDENGHEELVRLDDNKLKKEINDLTTTSIQKTINDLVNVIKASLCIRDDVPTSVLCDLSKLCNEELEQVFNSLKSIISLEDTEYFWHSICDRDNLSESVVLYYIRIIFLPMAREEFRNEMYDLFVMFSEKYSPIFTEVLVINCINAEVNDVLMKYLAKSSNRFKTELLRAILSGSNKLGPQCITIIEVLLNAETDANTQSQLIKLMCNAAVEFINDNSYGKLLFIIVKSTKHLIPQWEPLLRHILSIHQSIWKIKVQKVIMSNLIDSSTQSFS